MTGAYYNVLVRLPPDLSHPFCHMTHRYNNPSSISLLSSLGHGSPHPLQKQAGRNNYRPRTTCTYGPRLQHRTNSEPEPPVPHTFQNS